MNTEKVNGRFFIEVSDCKSKFSSAHFLYKHDKCSRLHGHNYSVRVRVGGELNEGFMVADFFIIKKKLREITERLDHRVLLPGDSKEIQIEKGDTEIKAVFGGKRYIFPASDTVILPIPATTAEMLAYYIYSELKKEFSDYNLEVYVSESEGSTAVFSGFR